MFHKVAVLTDLHFGRKSNDKQANQDNLDFIDWFIDEARTWGADTCIMMGDYHDARHTLHISTLNASLRGMVKLDAAFEHVYFISGNHDLFFRERRDLTSIVFSNLLPNITLVNDPLTIGEVSFLPWLVGDEWKQLRYLKSRYIFGHLELPGFMMNANRAMPDHGGANAKHFVNQEYCFSGHYHLRQQRDNVIYTGNIFPFNFSDDWDEARGAMLLEWGKEPIFRAWPEQPTYRTMTLSALVENPAKYLTEKTTARVSLDVDVSFEEAQFLRDSFCAQFGARRIDLVNQHTEDAEADYTPEVAIKGIDELVHEGLASVESVGIKPALLLEIYKSLS